MRNLFIIVLCATLALVSLNTFGQKPVKPSQQVKPTTATVSKKPAAKPGTTTTEKCWEITNKNNVTVEYRWDTEANIRQWINEMRTQHNETYSYTSCNHKTVEACDANNEKCQPKKCWKITASKNNQGYEENFWSTETVARRKVAALQSNGYQQARYVEVSASNEKDCTEVATGPSCWEITINNVVSFYWGYESDVLAIVTEARNSGKNATYQKTDLSKDSCIK